MDMLTRPQGLKVLVELRPALDKHAGIPQQNRLLFKELTLLHDWSVEGLIQSSTHALGKGVSTSKSPSRRLAEHEKIDRLSRVVIMLEQKYFRSHLSPAPMLLRRVVGCTEKLHRFDGQLFRDFIWRRLFARSLPATDLAVVSRAGFRIARTPWSAMHIGALISKSIGFGMFPRLDTSEFDVMVAETPYPASVAKRTRLVVRYHDAIPLLMPHTISDRVHHQGFHYRALRHNVDQGAWFACVSDATRSDLLSVFPQAERRSVTIHNMISADYFDEPSSPARIADVIQARLNPRVHRGPVQSVNLNGPSGAGPLFLLMVSTIEPRKNHLGLLNAWECLRAEQHPNLRLVTVGSLGWSNRLIMRKFRRWVERGDVFMLEDVPSAELRLLYKHAQAVVCPSFAEGFDLSGIEAMACGGVVAASDIPVHREIFSDAAEYFNPYSREDLTGVLRRLIDPANSNFREKLAERGKAWARRYLPGTVLPQWREFLAQTVSTVWK